MNVMRRMYCPDTEAFENVAVPIPCDREPCRSPLACSGFGYCRLRNMLDPAIANPFKAFYREKDMLDEMLGKGRP